MDEQVDNNWQILKGFVPELTDFKEKSSFFFLKDEKIVPDPSSNLLLVLGLNPFIFPHIKNWLSEKDHFLLFMESDLSAFTAFTKHPLCEEILTLSQIKFVYLPSYIHIENILVKIAWEYVFLKAELKILPSYTQREKYFQGHVESKFTHIFTGVHLSASAFSDFGIKSLKNTYEHIQKTPYFTPLYKAQNSLANIPALICGAGPSLNKIHQFKEKIKDKAVVFSGGSSLSALGNIFPHIVGCVDKDSPSCFYEKNILRDSLFFYTWNIPYAIYQKNYKKKILCGEKKGYILDGWLKQSLGLSIDGFDMGWSLSTFLTSLAIYLGCNPIIFVGVDLGYSEKDIYAKGVDPVSYEKKKEQEFYRVINRHKKIVHTQKDWHMSSFFLQDLTSAHKNVTFYNISKQGLDLGDRVKDCSFDLLDKISTCPIKKSLDKAMQQLKEVAVHKNFTQELFEMFSIHLKRCDEMLYALEHSWKGKTKLDISLEDSWCAKNVLGFLWDIWKHYLLRYEVEDEDFPYKKKLHQILFYKQVLLDHEKLAQTFFL